MDDSRSQLALPDAAPDPGVIPAGPVRDRRAIVDREALGVALDALAARGLAQTELQAERLALLRETLEDGRVEVRRRFEEKGASGRDVAKALSFQADTLICALTDHITRTVFPEGNPSAGERLALVAVGGYGRGELAPRSDIDLLFLLPYKITARHEQVVETLLYLLWDLGFKVGHSTRSIDECIRQAKADTTICTAILERRFLWGDRGLMEELDLRFMSQVQARGGKRFTAAKLAERDQRHERQGNSRYTLEPNIKEGKGGLRDLHTLYWIAKYLYQVDEVSKLVKLEVLTRAEARRFAKAEAFLWTLRCHLHYVTGRAEERLTFDLMMEIAPRMGYRDHAGARAVERFMKHYFLVAKDVGDLTRVLCASLEARHLGPTFKLPRLVGQRLIGRRRIEGFPVEGPRLTVKDPGTFAEKPIEMLRIFKAAQDHELDVHPDALREISRNLKRIDAELRNDERANKLFVDMLSSKKDPETTLRRMNEAGVFGRFLPDFGRVVAMMQFNRYHHFTVDEHTIFAIGELSKIESGETKGEAPIASHVIHKVLSRKLLYVAVLLHDIAKGRKGDHSELGAKVAHKVCPRLGLDEEETETVAWLVTHHLVMSHTAFTRDMDDPQTLQDFAGLVQSMERLRLLLVLTVADIRAVGPGTWNAWKASLLRDLYWRTEELLSGGLVALGSKQRIDEAKEAMRAQLEDQGKAGQGKTGQGKGSWSKKEIARHLTSAPASYWLSGDTEGQLRHARMIREARQRKAPLMVETRVDGYRGVTELTVYTADTPGLFSRIAGAIAAAGGSIDGARIYTLDDGMALDSFYLRAAGGGAFDGASRIARLSSAIERTLSGQLDPAEELLKRKSQIPSRLRVFTVAPRVLIDNNASADYTVVEVNGRDRPGLLFGVTAALTAQKCTIHSAKISTFGERVVDVFYIHNARDQKIVSKTSQARLRDALIGALEAGEGGRKSQGRDTGRDTGRDGARDAGRETGRVSGGAASATAVARRRAAALGGGSR